MNQRLQRGPTTDREGGILIEASLVVALMCLVLFGSLQISRLYAAREVLDYAAMNGARARAVGLNTFMVHKVVRVSTIPNAGRMRTPEMPLAADTALNWRDDRPGRLWDSAVSAPTFTSPRALIERQRIPFYLAGENHARLSAILDYDAWETVTHHIDQPSPDAIRVHVRQRLPFSFPMSGAFAEGREIHLRAGDTGARMANHSSLYLE